MKSCGGYQNDEGTNFLHVEERETKSGVHCEGESHFFLSPCKGSGLEEKEHVTHVHMEKEP
jgi:hypothetical protein